MKSSKILWLSVCALVILALAVGISQVQYNKALKNAPAEDHARSQQIAEDLRSARGAGLIEMTDGKVYYITGWRGPTENYVYVIDKTHRDPAPWPFPDALHAHSVKRIVKKTSDDYERMALQFFQ